MIEQKKDKTALYLFGTFFVIVIAFGIFAYFTEDGNIAKDLFAYLLSSIVAVVVIRVFINMLFKI
jgi:hypothetical protein